MSDFRNYNPLTRQAMHLAERRMALEGLLERTPEKPNAQRFARERLEVLSHEERALQEKIETRAAVRG